MKCAVLTAYSPRYKRVAQLCTPSQKTFAARAGAEFFELTMADNCPHAWCRVDLISSWLSNWHAVFWVDADCIIPQNWCLPGYRGNCKAFFPWQRDGGVKTALTHASLWINSPESFALLNSMRKFRVQCTEHPEDRQALNMALQQRDDRSQIVGCLDRGLVHYANLDWWDKLMKLRNQTTA